MPDKKVKANLQRLTPIRPSPFEVPQYVRDRYTEEMHYTWQEAEDITYFENMGYEIVKRRDGEPLTSKKLTCMAITQAKYEETIEYPALHEDAIQRQDGALFGEREKDNINWTDISDYEPRTDLEKVFAE
jgi:hypothetical protein